VKDGIRDNRCNVLTITFVNEGDLEVLALCLEAQAAIDSVTPLPSVDVKLPAPVESRRTKTFDVDDSNVVKIRDQRTGLALVVLGK
jgi:hypothetical protein